MSAPPRTILTASPDEASALRAAVRNSDVTRLRLPDAGLSVAGQADVAELVALLSDPAVSAPIYDLPQPLTVPSIGAWVDDCVRARDRGEGLLLVIRAATGPMMGYSKMTFWPERASAEIAGALRADRHSAGTGSVQLPRAVAWMFTTLGVRLICLTAALDNERSARMIDRTGFVRAGEREVARPDGGMRRSRYWELTREQWAAHGDQLSASDR